MSTALGASTVDPQHMKWTPSDINSSFVEDDAAMMCYFVWSYGR
jgi:hypothetical protein